MMNIQLRYNRETVTIQLPTDACVSQLMAEITQSLSIPPENQKIIYQGRVFKDPSENLEKHKVKDGAKLLLMQTESPSAAAATKQQPPPIRTSWISQPQPEFLNTTPHSTIISKGVPPKCEKPYQSQMALLPKTPFIVYNTEGVLSNLSFESDAVWIESEDEKKERIFFSDLRNILIQEIPGFEKEYIALCLITKYGKRWFYFIPNQYSSLLSKLLAP